MNDGGNNIKDLITVRSDFKAPNTLDSSVVESQEPFETLNTMYVEWFFLKLVWVFFKWMFIKNYYYNLKHVDLFRSPFNLNFI